MEDFDNIDALAKRSLADRVEKPSENGWAMIQAKMKRKKRKRWFWLFPLVGALLLIPLQCAFDHDDVDLMNSEKITQEAVKSESNTISSENTKNNTAEKPKTNATSETNISSGTTSETNKIVQNTTSNGPKILTKRNNVSETQPQNDSKRSDTSDKNDFSETKEKTVVSTLTYASVKLTPWELITPEKLKKETDKKDTSETAADFRDNWEITVGLNGFLTSDAYDLSRSYFVELAYTDRMKLKYNNFYFNYGASVQYRNLYLLEDINQQNRGEVSLNVLANLEKRFGNFGVFGGVYTGFEVWSPNNNLRQDDVGNLFKRKFNYGINSGIRYKQFGIIFKYEFTPYINYLGDKQYEGFIFGAKYYF